MLANQPVLISTVAYVLRGILYTGGTDQTGDTVKRLLTGIVDDASQENLQKLFPAFEHQILDYYSTAVPTDCSIAPHRIFTLLSKPSLKYSIFFKGQINLPSLESLGLSNLGGEVFREQYKGLENILSLKNYNGGGTCDEFTFYPYLRLFGMQFYIGINKNPPEPKNPHFDEPNPKATRSN